MTTPTSTGSPRDGPAFSRRALLFGLPGLGARRLDAAPAAVSAAKRASPVTGGDEANCRIIGRRLEPAADALVCACAVVPGQRWLDVGAGEGTFALAAARAGAEVVAVDPAPALLARGRTTAEALGLAVDWRAGDAARLPVDDAAFDGVASSFGIIYAPDSRRAVDELDRVLRPGGMTAVTAWASSGFMGAVLRLAADAEERGPDRPRPERWGRYEGVQLAFSRFPGFEVRDESLRWEFESVDAVWEELTAPPGPLSNALECGAAGNVRDRLMALVNRHGRRDGDRVVLDVGYLLVLARKPAAWPDAGGGAGVARSCG